MLLDKFGRNHNYLRLAVTDRCNLRCFYCMPAAGIKYVDRKDLLSYEEMLRLSALFASQGVSKIRITGGEPFVRSGMAEFLKELTLVRGVKEVHITSNGSLISDHIGYLEEIGIKSINLSLDSLDQIRFAEITRRDVFPEVRMTLENLIESSIDTKVNMVVMKGKNIDDIIPMLELGRKKNVSVRYIEEMPFNGNPNQGNQEYMSHEDILAHIRENYSLNKIKDAASSTSLNYQVEGFKGSFGIIPAYTRTICGSCNRLRLTPQGEMRTCLYGEGKVSLRDQMREGHTDSDLINTIRTVVGSKAKNGFEAEAMRNSNNPVSESMATIGG